MFFFMVYDQNYHNCSTLVIKWNNCGNVHKKLAPASQVAGRTYLTNLKRAWSANFKMVWYVVLRPLRPELDGQLGWSNKLYMDDVPWKLPQLFYFKKVLNQNRNQKQPQQWPNLGI
jgi:hypothetical protein